MSEVTKSSALSRIESLLDENSFVELGALVTARSTDFNLNKLESPSDGVVIGHGLIDGNLVFVYSQDASVLNGSIGEMHAKKIVSVYDMAVKMGAPVIGILDSTGVRLQESVDALEAIGTIYSKAVAASGVVPQITAVFGNCGGGLSVLPAISDFAFMTEGGKLFVNSPDTIEGNRSDVNDTASADFQFKEAGSVDAIGNDEEIFDKIRQLVSILPSSNLDGGVDDECLDDLNRASEVAGMFDDPAAFAREISDNHIIFEAKAGYATEMVTALIKLDGLTVGVVGNREKDSDAVLTSHGAVKASDFVRFCDAFDIPVLTLTNLKGYDNSIEEEKRLTRALAKLTCSLAEATVPKINVITKQAVGTSYLIMNSKALGADLVYAYPETEMGIMEPALAAKIIGGEDLSAVADEFAEKNCGVNNAARRGAVDRIINTADTRKYLIAGFEMLYTKSVNESYKKHGTK